MKKYLRLMRVKQYIKNFLIFVPSFFAGTLLELDNFCRLAAGFTAFSMICSAVYIMNDIKVEKKDRLHPLKKKRPIASGEISVTCAIKVLYCLVALGYIILSICKKAFGTRAIFT